MAARWTAEFRWISTGLTDQEGMWIGTYDVPENGLLRATANSSEGYNE